MDAIILAGGKGTRLQDIVKDVPKPLALINDVPFLDILINRLENEKIIDKIILSIGYKKEKIIDRYKDKKNIVFSSEDYPLGTGGAIKKAINLTNEKKVLVLNGDTFVNFSIDEMLNFHLEKKSDATILYKEEKKFDRYGSLIIDSFTKKINSFNEKIKKDIGNISLGVYIFNISIFENLDNNVFFSLENDFFPKILNKKYIFGFETTSSFIDIGTKDSYIKAQKFLK
jgi:D-glycero-alpha-D-manno-heptose 1-phosphate guanylyltransferase